MNSQIALQCTIAVGDFADRRVLDGKLVTNESVTDEN